MIVVQRFTALILLLSLCLVSHANRTLAVSGPLPDFNLPTLAGQNLNKASLKGKIVVLNFWATWCAPCLEELPVLDELYQQYKDQGVVMLGVNVDNSDKHDKVRAQVNQLGTSFEHVLDAQRHLLRASEKQLINGNFGMPATLFIDQEGQVHYVHRGYSASDNDQDKHDTLIRYMISR